MEISTFVGYLPTVTTALFNIASEAVTFITANPICLMGTILWVFVAGAGIVRSFIKGV